MIAAYVSNAASRYDQRSVCRSAIGVAIEMD
jgi:hypothetical protein